MAGIRTVRGVVVAFLTLCQPLYSQAQTVWSGAGGNDNWTTPQNWLGGVAPLSGPNTWIRLKGPVRLTPVADNFTPWVLNRIDFHSEAYAGSFSLSGNQLSFQGAAPQINNDDYADEVINNDIDLRGADLLLTMSGSQSLALTGHISGAGGLAVATTVQLSNANTYDGPTIIGPGQSRGTIFLTDPKGLGSTVGGTIIRAGGLWLKGGITVDGEALTLTANGHYAGLVNYSGNNTWTSDIAIVGNGSITAVNQGETLTLTGAIDGGGTALQAGGAGDIVMSGAVSNLTQWALSKWGTGTLTLSGANKNISEIIIEDGALVATTQNALPPATFIQLDPNSGNYNVNAYPTLRILEDTTIGGLTSGSGGLPILDLGSNTLTINQDFFTTFYGQVNGSGSLIKTGAGSLQLSLANPYSGSIVIKGGALRISQDSDLGAVAPADRITLDGGALEILGYYSVILDANRTIRLAGPGQFASYLNTSNSFIVQSQLTGPGALSMIGPFVRLSNPNNDYTGGTTILSGVLQFDNPGAIGGTGPNVKIASGATATAGYPVDQAFLARIDPTSSGIIGLNMANGNDLDFGAAGLTSVYLGAIGTQTFSGTLSSASGIYRLGAGIGTLVLTKLNAIGSAASLQVGGYPSGFMGTVILSNNNNIGGSVTVNTGTLKIDASTLGFATADVKAVLNLANATLTGTTVTVEQTGFLTGCGTIDADLVNGGQTSVTCGQFTVNGSLTNNGQLSVHGDTVLVANGSFVNNGLVDLLSSPNTVLPPGLVNNGTIVHFGEVKIESAIKTGGMFSVVAHSLSGHAYQLQRATSLTSTGWLSVGVPTAGRTGSDLTLVDYSSSGGQMFYRIQVSP